MATVSYEADADRSLIADKKVAILGYGSQGHAHALNLADSGVDVRVGLRDGSSSAAKASEAGLKVAGLSEAVAEADIVMILLPDTEHEAVWNDHVAPNLSDGDTVLVAHGFSVRFGYITPPEGVDVALVARRARATSCGAPTPRAAAFPR